MTRRLAIWAVAAGLLVQAVPGAAAHALAPSAAAAPSISLHASPAAPVGGRPVTLSGVVTGAPAGSGVQLFASPYPYQLLRLARATTTAADGTFSFTVYPDRDTRYQALLVGTSASTTIQLAVTGLTVTKVLALPLGQAEVTIVVFHPRDLRWADARVSWSFATGRRGPFMPAPQTRTMQLSPYVVVLRKRIDLPAGPFRFRACFRAPG
ncbi:MAG: hypothetical protein JO156_06375, partial [Solirubrobacterales bacterium]|nr:hypothetical protein [Solirubrobacterales bacterium]